MRVSLIFCEYKGAQHCKIQDFFNLSAVLKTLFSIKMIEKCTRKSFLWESCLILDICVK